MRIRSVRDLVLPLFVTFTAAFFGMFLPMGAQRHNVVWESLYGLGFYLAGFLVDSYSGNRVVGVVGLLLWPIVASVIVFFVARRVSRSSGLAQLLIAIVFVASLFVCVSHDTENYLSVHGAPLYWNLYATFY